MNAEDRGPSLSIDSEVEAADGMDSLLEGPPDVSDTLVVPAGRF